MRESDKKKTLSRILGDFDQNDFFKNNWGKKFKYIQGQENRFEEIINWKDINYILNFFPLTHPYIRMVKDGKNIKPGDFLEFQRVHFKNTAPKHSILPEKIAGILQSGGTLILQDLHMMHPGVQDLSKNLEIELGDNIQVNGYLGWNKAKGFDIHHDTHDVIVLQVYGNKKWFVYGKTQKNPIKEFSNQAEKPEQNPFFQKDISSGDLLYLPRGCWHKAEALSGPTLHLTIGIKRKTGIDFLKWIIDKKTISIDIMRDNLPRPETNKYEDIQKHEKKIIKAFSEKIKPGYLEEFLQKNRDNRSPLRTNSLPVSVDFNFSNETCFKKNSKTKIRVEKKSKLVRIHACSSVIQLPIKMNFLINLILENEYFSYEQFISKAKNSSEKSLLISFLKESIEKKILAIKD